MVVDVLKPFQGERPYQPGERVDASGWRTLPTLIALRKVAPVQFVPENAATPEVRRGPGRPRKEA